MPIKSANNISPPYQRLVWDYKNANASSVQKALNMIDCNKFFSNANVEKQVNILNDTLFNIFSNFVRSMAITINDGDPPWINEWIKCKIKSKNKTFQQYLKNGRNITAFEIVDKEAAELSEMIQNRKERYFYDLSVKLNNPQTSPKTYWSIIKSCYNGRKIPIILPLSLNGKIIIDFNEKANLFNKYFSSQCNPLPNDSKSPENQIYIAETILSSFNIEDEVISKITNTLDINKAHGHDEVSTRILRLGDKSIVKSLSIMFNNCKLKNTFPNLWRKANVVPIHKKGEKDLIKNYRPVSLLPILGKIFERLIFNSLFKYINPNQSGFRPFDSCVNQLRSINHGIFSNFDCDPPKDILAVFLDISKVFDKI